MSKETLSQAATKNLAALIKEYGPNDPFWISVGWEHGLCYGRQESAKEIEVLDHEITRLGIELDNSLREIEALKAAFREVLTDAMNYWDNDPCNQRIHSRKAKEVYAEEIKLCGLEVDK